MESGENIMTTFEERRKHYKKAKFHKSTLTKLLTKNDPEMYMIAVVCGNNLQKMQAMYKKLKKEKEIKATI